MVLHHRGLLLQEREDDDYAQMLHTMQKMIDGGLLLLFMKID